MLSGKISPPLKAHIQHSIKTGLACVISYAVSYLLGSQYAVWAVITSIIAMQGGSVADSVQAGVHRLTGMGMGAAFGVIMLIFFSSSNNLVMALTICILTTIGAYITRYGSRYMLASIGTCTVLLAGVPALEQFGRAGAIGFSLTYVWEIGVGAGSAFLVSLLIWPVRMIDTLRTDLVKQFRYCSSIFNRLTDSFLNGQQQLSPHTLVAISMKVKRNSERLSKIAKNESFLYKYEHKVMEIQALAIERTLDAMRMLLDNLNEYDEEEHIFAFSAELRSLADMIIETLKHLGGEKPKDPRPDLVRSLTKGVDDVESKLNAYRSKDLTSLPLHRLMQLCVFYQTLRQLTEELLLALDQLHSLKKKKKLPATIYTLRQP